MKNFIFTFCAAFICISFMACSELNEESVADPDGTVVMNFANGGHVDIPSFFLNHETSTNNFLLWTGVSVYDEPCIASLGKVAGLGSIKNAPNSGYGSLVASKNGYGYVVRYPVLGKMFYMRFYVVRQLVNVRNEIIGAEIKYQFPFVPANDPNAWATMPR